MGCRLCVDVWNRSRDGGARARQARLELRKKYDLPIKISIQNIEGTLQLDEMDDAYTEDGICYESAEFTGMPNREGDRQNV